MNCASSSRVNSLLLICLICLGTTGCKRAQYTPYHKETWELTETAEKYFTLPYGEARYVYMINGEQHYDTCTITYEKAFWTRYVHNPNGQDSLIKVTSVIQHYYFQYFTGVSMTLDGHTRDKGMYYMRLMSHKSGGSTFPYRLMDSVFIPEYDKEPRFQATRINTLNLTDTTLYDCYGFSDVGNDYRYAVVASGVGIAKLQTEGKNFLELKTILWTK